MDGSTALDFSMFETSDLVNLVLQRSDVLGHGRAAHEPVRHWEAGYSDPLVERVEAEGQGLARRAAGLIHAEFRAIEGLLHRLTPRSIADIGCGYAIFDLFAYRVFGASLLLIDIEETEARHFGYRDEGAGYSSLATARAFLVGNGVPEDKIKTWNPAQEEAPKGDPLDLAVSFLSCGFHYPVDMYIPFFRFGLTPRGAVILDLRAARASESMALLETLGKVRVLSAEGGVKRVLLKKQAAA